MSDPSPATLSVRLALLARWCGYGAMVASVVFASDTVAFEITRSLGVASPGIALLTFWLMTVVVQAAIWWVKVAAREHGRPLDARAGPRSDGSLEYDDESVLQHRTTRR